MAGGVEASRNREIDSAPMLSCFGCAVGPKDADPAGKETVNKLVVTEGKTLEIVVSAGSQVIRGLSQRSPSSEHHK